MKGYRFYKEYNSPADKRKDKPNGNVFATCGDKYVSRGAIYQEGFGAIYFDPNSPCCFTAAHLDWIRCSCKRISEREARKIHPNLFKRIED